MKTGPIIIGIVVIIAIVLLYAMFVKTPFDATAPGTTNSGRVPTTSVMTPTEPWFLQYDRYAREAGIDVNATTNPNTLPNLNTKQLRDEGANGLMVQNAVIRRRLMPDLYPAEDTAGVIAEDQAPVDNTSSGNEGAVKEQTTYDHDNSSIIGAGAVKEIGTSIVDIGKTITELPGEMGGKLGYAGYNVSSDYNLLPASLYNNMWDYKQSSSPGGNYDASTGAESNILDKMPRAILQKDFAGVSNIFAPNFIFLGKKDDYSIGFDENWQYP